MDSADQDIEEVAERLGEELVERILRKEDLDVIFQLLDSGYPVWYQNLVEGTSPLHAAAYVQDLDLARLLLDRGAVWNAGRTLLLEFPFQLHEQDYSSRLHGQHRRRHRSQF